MGRKLAIHTMMNQLAHNTTNSR